jgi:peptidoglycan/LPS O-acetylase OafA/YrhL
VTARNPRFQLFDSLRAIAAFSIVLFHVSFMLEGFTKPGVGRYLTQLNIGVPIFFVISAFLLYRPFASARLAGDPQPATGPYAIRRFFRIFPAYWVALLLTALWLSLDAVSEAPHLHFGLLHAYDQYNLLNGLGHAWTLVVELSFYVLLPIWAFAVRRLPCRSPREFALTEAAGLAVLFAAGLIWNLTQVRSVNGVVLFDPHVATLPRFLDHFALGMTLAVASVLLAGRERQPGVVRLVERRPWVPWVLAAAGWLVLCNLGSNYVSIGAEPIRHELRGLIAVCLLLPAVFGETRGGAVRRFLGWAPVLWVGLISYSLYLWHPAIMNKLVFSDFDERHGAVPAAAIVIVGSLVVAAASFYLVERPAMRIGRRLASGGRRETPTDPGAEAGLGGPADEKPAEVPARTGSP